MTSDDPGSGQKYAIMARKHIVALRAKEPGVKIEIRWCPRYHGIERNEVADEWAKLAADEPDAHGLRSQGKTTPSNGKIPRGRSSDGVYCPTAHLYLECTHEHGDIL